MSFKRFIYDGVTRHDLQHLHPFTFRVIRPAVSNHPESFIEVHATFSWHCYTRTPDNEEQAYRIISGREIRCFCPDRYTYSFQLPEIIAGLSERKVFQTGQSNFVTIEFIEENGTRLEYEVYFQVSKIGRKTPLKLFVESGYVRRANNRKNKPKRRQQAIRFRVLAHNIHIGKPIKYKT